MTRLSTKGFDEEGKGENERDDSEVEIRPRGLAIIAQSELVYPVTTVYGHFL